MTAGKDRHFLMKEQNTQIIELCKAIIRLREAVKKANKALKTANK